MYWVAAVCNSIHEKSVIKSEKLYNLLFQNIADMSVNNSQALCILQIYISKRDR